jgi:hypothetical protein
MPTFRRVVLLAAIVLSGGGIAAAQGEPSSPPPSPTPPPPGLQPYQTAPTPAYQGPPPPGPAGYPYQGPPSPTAYPPQPPPPVQASPPPPARYPYQSLPPVQAPPPAKSGFLALPYVGLESHAGDSGNGLGVGFVLGTLLGGRLTPQFSLNGEIMIDVLNPDTVSGLSETAVEVDIALSPLFHAPFTGGEFVIGPKVGFFGQAAQIKEDGVDGPKARGNGYLVGFNAGAFFTLKNGVGLGGLFNFTLRKPLEFCVTNPGEAEVCDSTTDYPSEKILAFMGAALF